MYYVVGEREGGREGREGGRGGEGGEERGRGGWRRYQASSTIVSSLSLPLSPVITVESNILTHLYIGMHTMSCMYIVHCI